jgi:hypothetical protein
MTADDAAEPSPDPVAEALRMRASDADRERVAGILRDAYAEGRLSHGEYEERLTEVYAAATYGELAPVMRDLPVPPGTLAVPTSSGLELARPTPTTSTSPAGLTVRSDLADAGERQAVAIFGGFERKGSWTVPPEFNATCIFGGGELDLTRAVLTSQETVITAVCLFGGLEVTVPEGMVVRSEAVGIFGGVSVPSGRTLPGAPVLIIKGAAIFGGIEVKYPKESRRGRISSG